MPTIKKPNQYFDATLYTGNGSARSITNAGSFKPDFVWNKPRSFGTSPVNGHNTLYDSVRGATKELYSDLTSSEATTAQSLTSFNSNGFSVGTEARNNNNGSTYVAWQWRAGEGTTTVNTSGSTSSNVSVSTTAGFSIVTYTGTGSVATIGHGLGVAPKMIIVKNRTIGTAGDGAWMVFHASIGNTQYLSLNTTAAAATATNRWNNTSPTSTVFTVATTGAVNDPSNNYVAYCFAEIAGFSAFGSYTGNGSSDGPFVYTGFRPKFVLTKRTNGGGDDWTLFDTARNTYNLSTLLLRPNSSVAEQSNSIDILSNGFKWRQGGSNGNETSGTYIYMAFAEAPFKHSSAR